MIHNYLTILTLAYIAKNLSNYTYENAFIDTEDYHH